MKRKTFYALTSRKLRKKVGIAIQSSYDDNLFEIIGLGKLLNAYPSSLIYQTLLLLSVYTV